MRSPGKYPVQPLRQLPEARQLHAFHAAASARSLRECAVGLGISQPSVSRSIQLIEQGLQVTLLERSRQGVTPTPEGRQLQPGHAALVCANGTSHPRGGHPAA